MAQYSSLTRRLVPVSVRRESSVTAEDLHDLLVKPSRGVRLVPSRSHDEVYPGIIIGDMWTALDVPLLRSEIVGSVLNSCCGGGQPYLVDTDADFYYRRRLPARFLGIRAVDADWYPLKDWFSHAAEFIDTGLRHGKVLVHCIQGMSRSATLVIAYLMIKQRLSVREAVKILRARREIFPNSGFLQQLCQLEKQLMWRK